MACQMRPLQTLTQISVGLHLAQFNLPRLHHGAMHPRAVATRPVQPRRHRALIQSQGGHDRLDGAAVAHQRHHQHHDLRRVV